MGMNKFMIVKHKALGHTADASLQFAAITGIASIGQIIEDVTTQPISFWIVALLGAVLLRKAFSGPNGPPLSYAGVAVGMFIAFILTEPLLWALSLEPARWKPAVVAALAGGGEHVLGFLIKNLLSENTFKILIGSLTGRNK